jgi:hypothetical protein
VTDETKFQVFRGATAPTLEQTDVLRFESLTPAIRDGLKAFVKAGGQHGSFAKILINVPGFSLAYAWHKSGYPLPLHSHDVDCCYLVIAGELTVGTEILGKGDGFFVPAGAAYTFFTVQEGVEFVEFRKGARYDIRFQAPTKAWDRQLEQTKTHASHWGTDAAPEAVRRMSGEV